MEAARALASLPEQLRSRRFARECEVLRPLGVAFVLRRYGNTLDHADAEDAVAEVVIRLHRQADAGRAPLNLRAAFFTSCRNAAIDQLRSRSAKPTVALELVAEAPLAEPSPAERAELADDGVRLREAMGRMRPNYREAIVLRFGLGLTVPEIAERLAISLPAAKKLVLRATRQIRERMESIEGAEFCPEMRELAQRSLFDRELAGLAGEAEVAVLRAHFEHCGPCRSFLGALRENLHELGSTGLLTAVAAEHSGASQQIAVWVDHLSSAAQTGIAKLRLAAFKSSGALGPDGGGAAGALAGGSQKLAAICTAGAATATCLAAGVIGPGIGAVGTDLPAHHARPPAQVRPQPSTSPHESATRLTATTPPSAAPAAESPAAGAKTPPVPKLRQRTKSPQSQAEAAASKQGEEEFGFEGQSPAPTATPTASSSASSPSSAESSPPPSSGPAPSSSAAPSGHESFGFGG